MMMQAYLASTITLSASCVFLGIIGLNGESRKTSRKLFFFMCITMAFFLFCVGFSVSADNKENVVLWYRLSALGLAPFFAFNLHFYINLLYGPDIRKKDILLYIPVPLVAGSTLLSTSLFNNFVFTDGFWRYSPAYSSPWFWIYFIYYFPYTFSTVILIIRWSEKTGRLVHRKQALLISFFTMVTLVTGSTTDFLLPYLNIYPGPPIGPLTIAFYIYGLWFVLLRYNFMEITPAVVVNEIIDNIMEMVLILDPYLNITTANRYAAEKLGLDKDTEKNPVFFPSLVELPENTVSVFEKLKTANPGYHNLRLIFHTGEHSLYSDSYITVLSDSFTDITGFLVLSRLNRFIDDFIKTFKISKREMEIIEYCIEGKSSRQIAELLYISERTVETHLTNIFHKTGASNRIELFSLASRYCITLST